MRIIVTLLFLAVLVLGVWTFVDAPNHGWWLPSNVSSFGPAIDGLFNLIMWMVAVFFVLTEGLLIWCVLRYSSNKEEKGVCSHGNHKLEMAWTAVPGILLLVIAFSQMGTWAEIKFKGNFPDAEPIAEVYASQFDWRFVYPGEDGHFGTSDDLQSPYEFVVPVDEDIVFHLRSHDVLHSFFVPQFRFKQDAVPGMSIPCWFRINEPGTYDLICAELCGWGHYKMAGQVRVLPRDEYDAWLEEAKAHRYDNGSESN